MKKSIVIFISIFIVLSSFAQDAKVQQWEAIVKQGKKDTTTLNALDSLQGWYSSFQTDSGTYFLAKMKDLAQTLNDKKCISKALRISAEGNFTRGKTAEALKEQFEALHLAELLNDSPLISRTYSGIGNSHKEYGDYAKALLFYKKAFQFGIESKDPISIEIAALNLGYAYTQLNQLDSALHFAQLAYTMEIKKANFTTLFPTIEIYLGNINYKLSNYAIAKEYYQSALNKLLLQRNANLGNRYLVWSYLGLASCFKSLQTTDSSINKTRTALQIAKKISYLKGIRDANKLLSELFDNKHQVDSAFYYQKMYIASNDSLSNRDKSSAIESLTFEQELKENERQAEFRKQKEERSHNIQLAITAIAILVFLILFLLLSRSILVSHKVVAFLNVVVLLVVFEFINLLMHPFLERVTHHSPVLMLLALVAIAALIVPLHHRLEHWTTKKLVEKNKAIRLANAKKTIEELEERNTDNTNPTTTS